MKQAVTRTALAEALAALRRKGSLALVPTMGNLHAGHLALVERAQTEADNVVVSIFVNPAQFGPGEDFETYPRTLEADLARLREAGCALAFTPGVPDMYPYGPEGAVQIRVPEVSAGLCAASRPGHFEGVATAVARLLALVAADVAVFGEKDYQQLLVIRRLCADLGFATRIIGAPTIREPDGLAMSSRNAYLDDRQRRQAATLYAVLDELRRVLEAGHESEPCVSDAIRRLSRAGLKPEYLELRCAEDLHIPSPEDRDLIALAAVRLGRARLIDNVRVRRP